MENKAKEYAQELVNRFRPHVNFDRWALHLNEFEKSQLKNAKQYALICLTEKYEEAEIFSFHADNNTDTTEFVDERLKFLQSVKQEIEAL